MGVPCSASQLQLKCAEKDVRQRYRYNRRSDPAANVLHCRDTRPIHSPFAHVMAESFTSRLIQSDLRTGLFEKDCYGVRVGGATTHTTCVHPRIQNSVQTRLIDHRYGA